MIDFRIYISLFIIASFIAIVLFPLPAKSHTEGMIHYDYECCSNKDCAPLLKTEKTEDGDLMTTKHGIVFVPQNGNFLKKRSPDGGFHVCMTPPLNGNLSERAICVYYPELY